VTRREALNLGKKALASLNIEDIRLEAEVLLRHTLGIDRTRLYMTLNEELSPEHVKTFQTLLERRQLGVPLAYLVGHREFYGLDFDVNPDVLIPRPETELLVEKTLAIATNDRIITIADIGTGSGVIAVTLASKLPAARIYAVDISGKALAVARINAEKHVSINRITFLQGDLVQPLPEPCDLIVANLPYVKQSDIVAPINAEPRLALDGGPDGLDIIARFCRSVSTKLNPGGYILLEIGQGQCEAISEILTSIYPAVEIVVYPDLAGIERVVQARKN
jgi:release factor glutamine methyltransferase